MPIRSTLNLFIVLAVLAVSVACGGHPSPTAPSNPLPVTDVSAPTPVVGGATIAGTLSDLSGAASSLRVLGFSNITVAVAGTNVSAVVDLNGGFTLTNVPPGEVVLKFSGPGIDASLPLGTVADNDHLQIGVAVSGTTATLNSQVSTTPTKPTVTVKGTISRITGTCPSLTLTVGETSVTTSASTAFTGQSCTGIASGDKAEAVGAKQGDNTVVATSVEVTKASPPPPPPPPTPPPPPVTVSGTVRAFTGTCPALALKVEETYVTTTSATTFSGKTCGEVKTGDKVEVTGTKGTDGVVLATKVIVTIPTK
jgi:hypothetical protein